MAQAIEANGGNRFGKLPWKAVINDKEQGTELIETFYVYGPILNEAGTESSGFAVLSFSSTKIKPYRDWITAMYSIKGKPPIFANRAVLKSVKQKNDHGTFYNFRIDPLGDTWVKSLINPAELGILLEEAKGFRDMVLSGAARADFNNERSAGDEVAGGGADGEEAPF